jgi:hypothetical protein
MGLDEEHVAEKFAAFDDEQDPARVYEALDLVEDATRDIPVTDVPKRDRALQLWLIFLAAVDRTIDRDWVPEDVPAHGVPAPSPHGVVYPSGEVDPSTIPDPSARAAYEQALAANRDRRRQYSIQIQLRRIEERAMRFVEQLLTEGYEGSARDRRELADVLATSPAPDTVKHRVRAVMPRTPSP